MKPRFATIECMFPSVTHKLYFSIGRKRDPSTRSICIYYIQSFTLTSEVESHCCKWIKEFCVFLGFAKRVFQSPHTASYLSRRALFIRACTNCLRCNRRLSHSAASFKSIELLYRSSHIGGLLEPASDKGTHHYRL